MFSDISGLCNATIWQPTSTISSPLFSSPPACKQCKGKASVRVPCTPPPPIAAAPAPELQLTTVPEHGVVIAEQQASALTPPLPDLWLMLGDQLCEYNLQYILGYLQALSLLSPEDKAAMNARALTTSSSLAPSHPSPSPSPTHLLSRLLSLADSGGIILALGKLPCLMLAST